MATLIHGGYVVTMNPAREVFAEGFVLLGDDGRIDAVGPSSCAPSGFAGERLDANGMIVLPGLVNAGHRPWQHLLMGLAAATDEALLGAAERLLDSEDLAVAATLAATELVSGGTTTVLHHLPQRADAQRLQAATAPFAAAGMRQLACIDHAATGQDAAEAALGACAGLAAGRMGLALSVLADPVSMAEKRVDEAALASARTFARQHGLRIVCDLSGAADDARWAAAARAQGRSAPVHLMELGLLDQDWLVAGLQRLQAADLMLIRESGCAALATPLSRARSVRPRSIAAAYAGARPRRRSGRRIQGEGRRQTSGNRRGPSGTEKPERPLVDKSLRKLVEILCPSAGQDGTTLRRNAKGPAKPAPLPGCRRSTVSRRARRR